MRNFLEGYKPVGTRKANSEAREIISKWLTGGPKATQEQIEKGFELLYGKIIEPKSAPHEITEGRKTLISEYLKNIASQIEGWKTEVMYLYSESLNVDGVINNAKKIVREITETQMRFEKSWRSIKSQSTEREQEKYEDLIGVMEFLANLLSELISKARGQNRPYRRTNDAE